MFDKFHDECGVFAIYGHPEAANLARIATLTMQINFWLSFPMVFFMAASAHFPFLSGG